jgi:hypothetical protein
MHVVKRFLIAALAVVVASALAASCASSDDTSATANTDSSDDRGVFVDEVDGVQAMVADCFVSEASTDGRRYRTTVEVMNESSTAQTIAVTIAAELGRGGVSDAVEVPSGGSDAWAVVADEETTDPIGDVECADYILGVEVTLDG